MSRTTDEQLRDVRQREQINDIRRLAISFTVAVATAGRLSEELNSTVDSLREFVERRHDDRGLAPPPYTGRDRRA